MNASISLLNLKDAALYSERVIPVNFVVDYAHELVKRKHNLETYFDQMNSDGVLIELLPPWLAKKSNFPERLSEASLTLLPIMISGFRNHHAIQPLVKEEEIEEQFTAFKDIFRKFVVDFGLEEIPIDAGDLFIEDGAGEASLPSIALANMDLIDTSNCEWAQILEFRKDKIAAGKLRNLRLHITNEYHGKDRAFIEDDLHKRLDEYQSIIDEWGFETLSGSIGMLLSSKALAGGAAGSLVSILAGAPLSAALSLAGAVLLEAGKVTLHVQKQRFALRHVLQRNPVSFVKYAKEKLAIAD
jgi:hypothetical protein